MSATTPPFRQSMVAASASRFHRSELEKAITKSGFASPATVSRVAATAVQQLPAVPYQVREPAGGDRGGLEQQVGDLPSVPGALELEAPLEERHIGARLDLGERLGLDIGVARHGGLHQGRCAADVATRAQQQVPISIAWPVARAGPPAPELDLVEEIAEVRKAVGGRRAREDVVLVPIAVGA